MPQSNDSLDADRQTASRDAQTALQGGKDSQATANEQRQLAHDATTDDARVTHGAAADVAQRAKERHDENLIRSTGDYLKARDEQHRRGSSLP